MGCDRILAPLGRIDGEVAMNMGQLDMVRHRAFCDELAKIASAEKDAGVGRDAARYLGDKAQAGSQWLAPRIEGMSQWIKSKEIALPEANRLREETIARLPVPVESKPGMKGPGGYVVHKTKGPLIRVPNVATAAPSTLAHEGEHARLHRLAGIAPNTKALVQRKSIENAKDEMQAAANDALSVGRTEGCALKGVLRAGLAPGAKYLPALVEEGMASAGAVPRLRRAGASCKALGLATASYVPAFASHVNGVIGETGRSLSNFAEGRRLRELDMRKALVKRSHAWLSH